MFDDERTPLEHDHAHLMEALRVLDVGLVQSLLSKSPQAAQPMSGWRQSPFQALAGSMHSFDCSQRHLDCMDALLTSGASPMQGYAYVPAPMQTMIERACMPALERMHETGYLRQFIDQGVKAQSLGHFICTSTQWRDLGARYPVDAMMKLFLEAGMDPTRSTHDPKRHSPAIKQLLRASMPQYGTQRPATLEDAGLRLLDADKITPIEAGFVIQAFHAGYNRLFKTLLQRYEAQGYDMARIALDKHSKDSDRAQFDAWILDARNSPPEHSGVGSVRRRI